MMRKHPALLPFIPTLLSITLVLLTLTGLISCDNDTQNNSPSNKARQTTNLKPSVKATSQAKPEPQQDKPLSRSDWDKIKATKSLRIIVPSLFQNNLFLSRKSTSYNNELKLMIRFAKQHNLNPVIIPEKEFSKMLPALEKGIADVIVANLAITESRKKLVNFTYPVLHAIEQLVVAKTNKSKLSIDNLDNLKIGVRANTSFWETLTSIKEKQNKLQLIELDDTITADEKFDKIISGEIEATLEDSNRLMLMSEYRKDIKIALNLGKERPIAWAVRKNNPELLKQLNRYIKTEKLLQHLPDTRLGDLDSIKKHKQLRLITRNNASTYFLWKNKLMGFEYEMIKEFAKQQKVHLKVLIADDFEQMLEWLEQGYGDIVSSGLTKTNEREKLPVLFTDPYLFVQELIVQPDKVTPIKSLKELHQRTFYVRKSSSYWNTLNKLQQKLHAKDIIFSIKTVPESLETEEIIQAVINGQYDMTVADSHIIAIEKSWHHNIQASLPLTTKRGHHWLLRKTDTQLHSALNKYIKKQYKGLFYNISFNKYFKNSRKLFDANTRIAHEKRLSPYDELIKSIAKEYDVDWRLIAAQINKESQFNPKATSWVGAKGLLQVMPRTAKEVGITNLEHPESGLRAGIKYMSWISDQLSDELPADVKVWFTLAAYNAGLGHLKDARSLAIQQGLNPNRWFNHVEKALLMLSKPKYHKKARYGYVRGTEPVAYVKKIQALYELYSKKYPKA